MRQSFLNIVIFFHLIFVCCWSVEAEQGKSKAESELFEECIYKDNKGNYTSAPKKQFTAEQLKQAKCKIVEKPLSKKSIDRTCQDEVKAININPGFSVDDFAEATQNSQGRPLSPDEVEIGNNLRQMKLATSFGDVHMRWSRSVEKYLGKSPDRTAQAAWTAAGRAISQNSFPKELLSKTYNWDLVFMDQVPSNVDIGQGLCHPAWMMPPANIFVASERVATNCSGTLQSPADISRSLTETLIHELGHAVEFRLAKNGFGKIQRWHGEGFATWFETIAGQYVVGSGKFSSRSEMRTKAKYAFSTSPGWNSRMFRGDGDDYARSYAVIAMIAEEKGIYGLVAVYQAMSENNLSFLEATQKKHGWDENKVMELTKKNLGV
jgi:hypothetical protein